MTVAILGSGPAGLFAAHALAEAGKKFTIFSKGAAKSEPVGPLFVNAEIPGLTGEPFAVRAELRGTANGYRAKTGLALPTLRRFEAYDLREAYDAAWRRYRDRVEPCDLAEHPWFLDIIADQYDEVISTVPAPLICRNIEHTFTSRTTWITDSNKTGQVEFQKADDNVILYSGETDDWWFAQSRIRGRQSTEFPENRKPLRYLGKIWEVTTPIDTDCTCYDEFTFEGRMGSWSGEVDAIEAYTNTLANA